VVHDLKVWPEFVRHLLSGAKTFEVRKADRDFQVGDTLTLREWDPKTRDYTGLSLDRSVTYLLDLGRFGLHGYVAMGLSPTPWRSVDA
jgi:hypothetical protein